MRRKDMTVRKILLFYYFPLFCVAALIFYGSTTIIPFPKRFHTNDKTLHLISYCILAFFFIRAWNYSFIMKARYTILCTVFIVSMYGLSIEYIQIYCNRFFEWSDVVANTIGAILGVCLFFLFVTFFRKNSYK